MEGSAFVGSFLVFSLRTIFFSSDAFFSFGLLFSGISCLVSFFGSRIFAACAGSGVLTVGWGGGAISVPSLLPPIFSPPTRSTTYTGACGREREGNIGAKNRIAISPKCRTNENKSHFGNCSTELGNASDRSRKLIVGDAFSATNGYPSSDGGRLTIPNFSMPACLISAMVFITRP